MGLQFYTYLHFRRDTGQVFYVGKGCGYRAFVKCRRHRSKWWHSVADKHGFDVEIAARWPSEKEAFEHEKLLIECFRDLGHPLVNATDGGEGTSGATRSPEVRAQQSVSLKRTYADPELRAEMARRTRENWSSPDYAQRIREKLRSPEVRGLRSNQNNERFSDPEERARHGEKSREMWARPEYREKVLAAKRAANARPEVRYAVANSVMCVENEKTYPSIREAARETGLPFSSIQAACKGMAKKKVGGLTFRYAKDSQ